MNPPASTAPPAHDGVSTEPRFTGLLAEANALQPKTVALRRHLHKHPEQGLQLPHTQAAIIKTLDGLPMTVSTGDAITSVIGVLHGARPGPTVLLRGDMDALPLTETTGLSYASEVDGTMHACGHDTHVAMLASAARVLCDRRDALAGSVVFMFQPGEEGHHGARYMIEEGVLEASGQPTTRAYALHITASADSGTVRYRSGSIMAAADQFVVRVTGRGGHGAMPHNAHDPVPAAAEMVGALQAMLTRRVSVFDPGVLSVTRISAGTTSNIIPETAELEGTMRALSEQTRELLRTELVTVCEHVGAAHGCQVRVEFLSGYPVTTNDPDAAARVAALADGVLGSRYAEEMADPLMGAEDFSYVLQRVPGALSFLGACPPGIDPAEAAPNHSNRVCFDESAFAHGVAMYAAFALDALR
ncbi:MAG: amidohydrolase [Pseudonocardiaceae bacterium]|nr:amidohydrolase [Pseudonocardiaceae bacterium]